MRLKNKVAFITGGNSGMGLETAKLFEQEGAKVAIVGRRQEAIETFNAQASTNTYGWVADVASQDQTQQALSQANEKFGKIDILFINAGIAKPRPFEMADRAYYDAMWDVNFAGAYFTIQAALPYLKNDASIILNTSVSNTKGMPGLSVYAATKAAMRSLVRTLTIELAPRKIRVNAMSPGPIETPVWGKMDLTEEQASGFKEQVKTMVPLGRMGTSQEIAKAVLFLASDDSSYVNGVELPVDGGMAQV
ncbi:MAG TPA: hypothetical protein DCS93_08360 [Microscillaceae bacterium]|nr:hypothetical protein [Microscillaceae bacterium]